MAFTFAHGDGSAIGGDWTVTSKGAGVGGSRHRMCEVAASLIAGRDGAKEFIEAQRSAPLNVNQLNAQDLIITASGAERSSIARMNPDLRARTFTLREAILLGAEAPSDQERDAAMSHQLAAGNGRVRLDGYASVLHARRGLVVPPAQARRGLWNRGAGNPLDMPDVHRESAKRHRSMLSAMQADVMVLRGQISDFLARRP